MSEASTPEGRTLFELVKQRYGHRLTGEELESVRKQVEGIVEDARSLRSVKLEDTNEPPSLFVPYRKEG